MNLVGQKIGSYVVERELGSGGAGVVYLCRHTLIDRDVAVKVLHDEQAHDPDQVARFFQEAKQAADIGHPNIVVIIDYGTLPLGEGTPRTYLMMECLNGQSLDKRLRRGDLSLSDISHVLSQIASALTACHGKGIIHRDLKPSNIQLCDRSFDPLFVKLMDFGIAKLAAPMTAARRTQYGIAIGTPAYMSPEQCEGKGAVDHRSDIYSLGCVLYEMLSGTVPFDGEIGDILNAHIHRHPEPPSRRNPNIPPEWEALCLRMMEKRREARFQSITELAIALDDLRGHASAYEAFRTQRSQSHSGSTMTLDTGAGADRPTLHVDLNTPSGEHRVPTSSGEHRVPTPSGEPFVAISIANATAQATCTALLADPRHAAFGRALMSRPAGHWSEVLEVCATASVAAPALVPRDLYATWLEHPQRDQNLATVVFVSLDSEWCVVVPTKKPDR
ncbi:MAG TPA: serine/threonine-protein kinase [Kofleriaceae bacterium]